MSIRTGSRPKWLYWPKDGYWQFHVSWLRLHIAFGARKSKRRSNNLAGSASRQRSAAHDLALPGLAVLAFAESAVLALAGFAILAPAESAVLALAGFAVLAPAESAAFTLGVIFLGSPSVVRRLPLCSGRGRLHFPLPLIPDLWNCQSEER